MVILLLIGVIRHHRALARKAQAIEAESFDNQALVPVRRSKNR